MISRVTYVFREMWASLSRNLTLTVAALITSIVSLWLFGVTLLVQTAFDNQLARWSGGVEMVVYVENDATPEQVELIRSTLASQQPTLVKSVTYCDVPCSLAEAQRVLAGSPQTLEQLTADNTPSLFSVVPATPDDTDLLFRIRQSFEKLPKVRTVEYPSAQIDVIAKLKSIVGVRALVGSFLLLLASVLLIWNTIRTAMFARRREIEVMKLVGATDWFIRAPFMLEGLLSGLAGGLTSSVLLYLLNENWTGAVAGFPFEAGLSSFVVADTPWGIMGLMTLVGAAVGAIGSATAASRFLDV